MIKVSHVTKRYPARLAVDDISFEVSHGEIVGFLGPNGAGKTTTMRMLTGYLEANSGEIEVAGFNLLTHPEEVRKRIGYLPESCPLYPEMRVDEYLWFRAELKGVNLAARRAKVNDVKERCGLTEVGKRIIGQLSKGYRQRVGLADALVHNPDLLILDEPTVGLDPYQIRQVRELIRQLAQEHTILLSTHILPEVEAVCERILIINDGKIVASDTSENLHRMLHSTVLVEMEVRAKKEEALAALEDVEGVHVRECNTLIGGWLWIEMDLSSLALRTRLFDLAVEKGWSLRALTEKEYSLEDTFVEITQRAKEASL